ncbi:hypothetical protein DCO56_07790 [Sphingobacterium athyrii]|uniref:Uncharacterized protein n=1 Tax=Sphingobacterium athyrii TaxID=2152717 RepID=A0A363NVL2_9SPHI|nr:hypothetical protein DCO56_07790 [Sphingobacterium athyrii]
MIVILGVIMTVIEVDTVTHVVDRCLSVIVIIDTAAILLQASVGSAVIILGKKTEEIMIEVEGMDVDTITGMEEGTEISWMKKVPILSILIV